ncbi:MAG: hypothetical protein GX113_10205 [Actinobacteria bacterium]|nr:hypothetical protein [Actinomycetota bacterium]
MKTDTATLPLHGGKNGCPYPVDDEMYDWKSQALGSCLLGRFQPHHPPGPGESRLHL